jgi:hypothetical protein
MTQMSDHRFVSDAVSQANCATAEARSPLARPLHISSAIRALLFAMMFVGCVFPPSLSVDTTDAGLNAAPAITSVRSDNVELPEWESVNFEQGVGTLNLQVYDTDLGDILYPKVFVDYNIPDQTPPRANCTAAAGGRVIRSSTCPLAGLCQTADIGKQRTMQVVVFDRDPNIEGQLPLYQAMPPGGLATSRTYTLICQQKQT